MSGSLRCARARCPASARRPGSNHSIQRPQVFLQRFGIEPMLPNGERVSSLLTDSKRERATVRQQPQMWIDVLVMHCEHL